MTFPRLAAQVPLRSAYPPSMVELTPQQMQTMERLLEAGFRLIAIPPFENALCLKRGNCAAVVAPVLNGGLKVLAPPSYLVAGNLSVKVKRGLGEVFVWKNNEVEATPGRLEELARFGQELMHILDFVPQQ